MTLALYRAASGIAAPFLRGYLGHRARNGKEDPARISERFGAPSAVRPAGPVMWIHAASVGESLSLLSLVERLDVERPALGFVLTTGTVTSARLLATRLPPRVLHQYAPLDCLRWVRRFLDYWRPDVVLWAESEFWPNLLHEIGDRGIPAILVNARLSPRSYKGWRRLPGLVEKLLANFDLCLAQTEEDAARIRALGAGPVRAPGNLKFAAAPLPAAAEALAAETRAIDGRPTWLAASTHEGEEAVIAAAHGILRSRRPNVLTVIVPRHPSRGVGIAARLRANGVATGLKSAAERVTPEIQVYVADGIGELGVYYRLARAAFVGGSLVPHGGQNILEPARLGCPVVHGPYMTNFQAIAAEMAAAGATAERTTAGEIAAEVEKLIEDRDERRRRIAAGRRVAAAKAGVLDAVVRELTPYLDAAVGAAGIAKRYAHA